MHQFVLDYYVVLDSVLRDKPQVRRLLAWCRHCGIPFITDPRNAGRVDLGCPFGCADLHRCRRSTERSVRYNGSAKGKLKRYQREEKRRLAEKLSVVEVSQAAEVHSAATVEEEQDVVLARGEPLPPDWRVDHPGPLPGAAASATEQAASSAETAASGPVSRLSEDCGGPSPRQRSPNAIDNSPPAESERLQLDPGIVAYVQLVISLLEERPIHREEILEMLARTKRQHSFAREKRIDYVLRRLREEPEKPP